jgi:hypothetical protein
MFETRIATFDGPAENCLERCLRLAEQARKRAENLPSGDLRQSYLKLARDWNALAEDVERRAGLPPRTQHGS